MDIGYYRIYTDKKFWIVQNLSSGFVEKYFKSGKKGRENAISFVRSILGIK